MKIVNYILSGIVFLFIASSCRDSLGIEDNVLKTLLDTVPKTHNVRFNSDTIVCNIVEYEINRFTGDTLERFVWNFERTAFGAMLDTLNGKRHLWLNLTLVHKYDSLPSQRTEHVKRLRIEMDSIAPSGAYIGNGSTLNGLAAVAIIETLPNFIIYEQGLGNSDMSIDFTHNVKEQGGWFIKFRVTNSFLSKSRQSVKLFFDAQMSLFFREN
jgi:hypothetical protein